MEYRCSLRSRDWRLEVLRLRQKESVFCQHPCLQFDFVFSFFAPLWDANDSQSHYDDGDQEEHQYCSSNERPSLQPVYIWEKTWTELMQNCTMYSSYRYRRISRLRYSSNCEVFSCLDLRCLRIHLRRYGRWAGRLETILPPPESKASLAGRAPQ